MLRHSNPWRGGLISFADKSATLKRRVKILPVGSLDQCAGTSTLPCWITGKRISKTVYVVCSAGLDGYTANNG